MNRVRILVADDHKAMRDKIAQYLETDFEVVGAVGDGSALLEAESREQPDVCVLDISMPGLCGIDTARELQMRGSLSRIVFLTVHQDPDFLEAALESGGLAYVVKSRMALDLSPAIHAVLDGRLFISPTCNLSKPGNNVDQRF